LVPLGFAAFRAFGQRVQAFFHLGFAIAAHEKRDRANQSGNAAKDRAVNNDW
jgi:hypothetical protein